jgi:L-rhamnose mutarotase
MPHGRKVYLTKLRPEYRREYIEAHRNVPEEVLRRYGAAGMKNCTVHVFEDHIVLIIEADDHEALAEAMKNDPVDRAWQEQMGPMKDGEWQEMIEIFRTDW